MWSGQYLWLIFTKYGISRHIFIKFPISYSTKICPVGVILITMNRWINGRTYIHVPFQLKTGLLWQIIITGNNKMYLAPICPIFLPILTKSAFLWQIFKKSPNIKFHRNLSSGSCATACRQTGGQTWRRSLELFMTMWTCLKMGKQDQLIFRQTAEVLYFTATIYLSQRWPYNRGVSRFHFTDCFWKN
jgi:hypothetical protein